MKKGNLIQNSFGGWVFFGVTSLAYILSMSEGWEGEIGRNGSFRISHNVIYIIFFIYLFEFL